MTERTDWPALMRVGLGVLRLSPDSFWSMTPIELCYALQGAGILPVGDGGITRERLEALMAAYPDHAMPQPPGDERSKENEDDSQL